jgi:hypothetical protein
MARILRPDEWPKVEHLDLSMLVSRCSPENVAIVVVEDEAGEIVGCMGVLQITHLEGVWVKPELRRGIILRPLLRMAMALARTRGEVFVFGGAADGDDRMDGLIRRLEGRPMPLKFYAMPVKEYN